MNRRKTERLKIPSKNKNHLIPFSRFLAHAVDNHNKFTAVCRLSDLKISHPIQQTLNSALTLAKY